MKKLKQLHEAYTAWVQRTKWVHRPMFVIINGFLERFPTRLSHRHRPAGDRFAAGHCPSGTMLLVGPDAFASLPPRALSQTQNVAVPLIQSGRKPL